MIECPRCGFVQPKDQYCANCGVDIDLYRPKPLPIHTRLLRSPLFYVAVLISTLIVVYYIISQTTSPQREVTPVYPKAGKPVVVRNNEKTNLQAMNQAPQTPPPAKSPTTTDIHANLVNSQKAEKVTKPEAQVKVPDSVVINFIEMSKLAFAEVYNEGQILSDRGDFQSIAFNSDQPLVRLKALDPNLLALPGGRTEKIGGRPTLIFNFALGEEREEDFGLSFQVIMNELSKVRSSVEIEGFIHLPGANEGEVVNANFSGNYQIENKKTLLLVGLLPRQRLREKYFSRARNTPLNILASENFTNIDSENPSEFVIVIQLK